jgi:hypothetical protein
MTPEQTDGLILSLIILALAFAAIGGVLFVDLARDYREYLRLQKAKDAWKARIVKDIHHG